MSASASVLVPMDSSEAQQEIQSTQPTQQGAQPVPSFPSVRLYICRLTY